MTVSEGATPPNPPGGAFSSTMPAVVYRKPGVLDVGEQPRPAVGPHDVLIEVSHCGVCGSDLHLVLEGWGRPGTIPGHEYSGVVAEVGAQVRDWAAGDLVVGGPDTPCGECAMCRARRPSLCSGRHAVGREEYQGAFARYVLLPEDRVLAIPPGLDERAAALCEPLAVAMHAVTSSRVDLDASSRVLVSGAGPIGALVLAVLVARGVEDVVVVEPGERRRELAAALGAREVRLPSDLDVPTIAEPDREVDGAVDVVFECSGHRVAIEAGLAQLRRGGTLVLVGAGIDPPHLDGNRILLNELWVTGSFNYDHGGFEAALDLLASGALAVDLLVEPEDVPLDGLLDAMRRLAGGELAGKVMVVPHVEGEV